MENQNSWQPEINFKELQEKSKEYAQKGALEAIREYYTGYDSPYKKQILEQLHSQRLKGSFQLPDLVGLVNEALTTEINAIANEALTNTYLPKVREILTGIGTNQVKFSDLIKEYMSSHYCTDYARDIDDFKIVMNEDTSYWTKFTLFHRSDEEWVLYLHHAKDEEGNDINDRFVVESLPRFYGYRSPSGYDRKHDEFNIKKGDIEIQLPFQSSYIENRFVRYCTSLLLHKVQITMDCYGLDDEFWETLEVEDDY